MCPAIVGPFTGNFAEPVAKLTDANALVVVHDAEDLAQAVVAMLSAPRARAERAARGHNAVKLYADLPTRVAESLIGLLGSA